MLQILLTVLHVIVSVFLVLVVLLQTGKKADLAGAFGGGGSQTAFGTRGAATLLSKLTTVAAVSFMFTSLSLSLLASKQSGESGGSILPDDTPPAQTQQFPTPDSTPALPADTPADDGTGAGGETTEDAPADDPTGSE